MMMREECCALFFENFNSVVELFLLFLLFLLRRGVEKGATNAQVPPSFSFVVVLFRQK